MRQADSVSHTEEVQRPRPPHKEFRLDIEGLRAVAVLAVVLFHADIPGVGGGFVGVDVFFVISGFLITGLLWREASTTGTVRLPRFYGGRARRLLPASVAVGIVIMIGSAALSVLPTLARHRDNLPAGPAVLPVRCPPSGVNSSANVVGSAQIGDEAKSEKPINILSCIVLGETHQYLVTGA